MAVVLVFGVVGTFYNVLCQVALLLPFVLPLICSLPICSAIPRFSDNTH